MARQALFVSSSTYADPELAQLPSAARDAVELSELFADPRIGPFTVSAMESPSAQEMRVALEDLFADAATDDLVVLYLSGHGLKDMQGNLYFAAHDTRPGRLQSTAVSAQFLCTLLNSSRAEGAVVFLDCCYGGAFARGMVARAGGDPHVGDAFAALGSGARSRAVITASSAIEYAFEGERLTDEHVEPSVFASAMRDGLASGEADQDGDGWVGLNELFDYLGQRIRRLGRPQTPHLWTFGASGDLLVTRSPRGPRASVSALPAEIRELLSSPVPAARLGAATDLRQRALEPDLPMARAAVAALVQLMEDDSLRVRAAARLGLAGCTPKLEPTELSVHPGRRARAALSGPPVALDALVEGQPDGVVAWVAGGELVVDARAAATPGTAELQLRWAGGDVPVPLTVEADQPAATEAPAPATAEPAETTPAEQVSEGAARSVDGQPAAPAPAGSKPPDAAAAGAAAAEPAKPATDGRPALDQPLWLLFGALLWLVTLFLPAGTDPPLTGMSSWLMVFTLASGIGTTGVAGYRWFKRERRTLVPARVGAVLLHGLALVAVLWLVQDNEFWVAGVAAVLAVAGVWVYLLDSLKRDAQPPLARGKDQPEWLIAAAVLSGLAVSLPPFADNTTVPVTSGLTGPVFLLLSLVALGIGGYRYRRRDSLDSPVIGVLAALVLVVLTLLELASIATDDDGFGFGAFAAAGCLACAVAHVVGAFHRRR